jgi:hypothetical protein
MCAEKTCYSFICKCLQKNLSFLHLQMYRSFHLQMCAERYTVTEDLLKLSGRLRLITAQVFHPYPTLNHGKITHKSNVTNVHVLI